MDLKNNLNFMINTFKHLNNVEKVDYMAFTSLLYMIWRLAENTRKQLENDDTDIYYILQYLEGLMEVTLMIKQEDFKISDFTPFNFLLTDCMLRLEKERDLLD